MKFQQAWVAHAHGRSRAANMRARERHVFVQIRGVFMIRSFRLLTGASPLVLMLVQSLPAAAQSTGTQALESIETVTVTGINTSIGMMQPITVPKERSSINQDFINTQMAGQTVFESLNNIPGFNFTNNDPYGNSGGDVRLHGFDGARISFTWDGMPLNDTGNYALYTNQVADSEILSLATVNQGTTDVDSPSAAATGGVIAIRTTKPRDEFKAMGDFSYGSFNQERAFGRVDSGAFGPWNTLGFLTLSYDHYDKFKGPGYLQKRQINGGITVLNETDPRLIGASHATGVDLNGDGDTLDQIQVYSPSNTNTIRYGLNMSVLWAIDDNNTLQAAYSLDYGLHRQTGQMGFM
jgi:hypothetical protein